MGVWWRRKVLMGVSFIRVGLHSPDIEATPLFFKSFFTPRLSAPPGGRGEAFLAHDDPGGGGSFDFAICPSISLGLICWTSWWKTDMLRFVVFGVLFCIQSVGYRRKLPKATLFYDALRDASAAIQ